MVVARKIPVAPAPPPSRSASSQALPRPRPANKTKTPPAPPTNNKLPTPLPRPLPVKKKQTRSWFTRRLFLLLLSVFSVYTALVCPTDFPRTSPVCRSLDTCRTHILDPYVVPPIQSLLHQAEPHLTPLKPYAASTAAFTRTHLAPRAAALLSFTTTQFHTHVAPRLHWFFIQQYWNGIIKPIYYKGIHPLLESQSRPYRVYYHRFVVPYARRAAADAHVTYVRLRPHAIHYTRQAQKHIYTAYKAGKPHVLEAYRVLRPHVVVLLEKAQVQVLFLARKAGDARREFVDPHVRRIWEKVGEAEVVSSFKSSESSEVETPTPTQALAEEPTAAEPTPAASTPEVETETPTPTPSPSLETHAPAPSSSAEGTAKPATIPAPSPPAPFSESPIPTTEPAAASAASVVAASLHASELEDGDSVDEFLKAIGLGDTTVERADAESQSASASAAAIPTPDPEPAPAEEPSPEERKQLTAEKRGEITARHGRWQEELDVLVDETTKGVGEALEVIRAEAVKELAGWGKEGKGVVGEVEAEAGALVKGVEGYLKGVEGKGVGEDGEKEKEKWEKVLQKVEERFMEKVHDVQFAVHAWYVKVRDMEVAEIESAAAKVKSFAERAQGDIGLDYAWLDDVTYQDWQKYHDLMRTSENFTTDAQALQRAVETNPLVAALNEIETAVKEVADGFFYVMKGIRGRAGGPGGVFGGAEEEGDEEEGEGDDGEKTAEDLEVSILPISPPPPPVSSTTGPRVEEVILSRGKVEVEERLRDVPVEESVGARAQDEERIEVGGWVVADF